MEFDTRSGPFQNASHINYSPSYPLVNPIDVLLQENLDWQILLLTTKSDHWCYEKEWRIIIPKGNQTFQYNPSSLTGIYFGWKMPSVHKEIIHQILAKYPPQNFYEMRDSDTEYKVLIDDFQMPRSSL